MNSIKNKEKKYKIVYVGLHPGTLGFLNQEKSFDLCATSLLGFYFNVSSLNPINWLFKAVYFLRIREQCRLVELFFLYTFLFLDKLSSGVFFRYRKYLFLLSKKRIKVFDTDDEKLMLGYITENNVDVIVVNSWGIMDDKIISAPKFGTINVHPSKLPKYRGALPTLWSLKNKDKSSAVTYITLIGGVDAGNIIKQYDFQIEKDDDAIDLEMKVENILNETLHADVKKYLDGEIDPYPQDKTAISITAKYQAYRKIDWENEIAEDIYNKIILYPFVEPNIFCWAGFNGKKIEFKNARLEKGNVIEKNKGDSYIRGMRFFKEAKIGAISVRLFLDIGFADSVRLIFS